MLLKTTTKKRETGEDASSGAAIATLTKMVKSLVENTTQNEYQTVVN